MMEGVMIFVGGLLGSAHCVGMCGGFALTLGSVQKNIRSNLLRQTTYSLGRVFTYMVGGALAGYGGWRLGQQMTLVNIQAILCLVAGVLLIAEGLMAAGVVPRLQFKGKHFCPGAGEFAALLRSTNLQQVFAAGVLNGFLPCGLVYAYIALASSSGDMLTGAVIMVLFGLGTIPALVITGIGAGYLSGTVRRRIFLVAAWCLVLTGVLTIFRGASFLEIFPSESMGLENCPFCK